MPGTSPGMTKKTLARVSKDEAMTVHRGLMVRDTASRLLTMRV
jgi:hypothetical protein